MVDQPKKDNAQEPLTSAQRAEDGRRAMAEYEAAAIAVRAKTERLRALRLAREAEQAKTAPPKRAVKKKAAAKSTRKTSASPGTLSDWLEGQQKSGHRS